MDMKMSISLTMYARDKGRLEVIDNNNIAVFSDYWGGILPLSDDGLPAIDIDNAFQRLSDFIKYTVDKNIKEKGEIGTW